MKSVFLLPLSKPLPVLAAALLLAGLLPAPAQFGPGGGGGPQGPRFAGGVVKLFGDNSAFSAALLIETKGSKIGDISMPGKFAYDKSKTKFEMDITQTKGGNMPPGAAEQLKTMGLSELQIISRADKKIAYLVYPGIQAYVENPLPDAEDYNPDNFKMVSTETGKETIDGHPCVKNRDL